MTTPLSDPDNVMFFVVENYVPPDDGFTDDDVQRILNGQPLVASAVETFEVNEDKYDGGGMIALIPSDADLNRLALNGEEPRDDLHLTLWYLGDEPLDAQQREDVLRHTVTAVEEWNPVGGDAFGFALWNPNSEHPAWVLNVGDPSDENSDDGSSDLAKIRGEIWQQVSEDFVFPQQHTPWQPHVCIAYSSADLGDELRQRLGIIDFDKVRVAYGRDVYDIELTGGVKFDFPIVAAGDRNKLKNYWTKDPRGLAKWVDHAHPWTELYGHLKKHMPDEMAKRVASEWYHEVKGHWPNEGKGKGK